jgi:hypothetical protein
LHVISKFLEEKLNASLLARAFIAEESVHPVQIYNVLEIALNSGYYQNTGFNIYRIVNST